MPKYPIATAVKEDARIMRSKRDLRAALMELLKSTPFEKIAVIDICNKAMINKVTFTSITLTNTICSTTV